jgi:hypothetical protein
MFQAGTTSQEKSTMSNVHLYARAIYVTTGPAIAPNHDGMPFVNPDVPVGSVLAYDDEGNLFQRRSEYDYMPSFRAAWPRPDNRGRVRSHRDYWLHVQPSPDSPYRRSIEAATKQLVAGKDIR